MVTDCMLYPLVRPIPEQEQNGRNKLIEIDENDYNWNFINNVEMSDANDASFY